MPQFIPYISVPDIDATLWDAGYFYGDFRGKSGILSKPLADLGYTLETMLRGKYLEGIHQEDFATYRHLLDRFHQGIDDVFHCEYRIDGANDEVDSRKWNWIQTHACVIERDSSGRALKIFGTDRIITARKEAEKTLLEKSFTPEPMFPGLFLDASTSTGFSKEGRAMIGRIIDFRRAEIRFLLNGEFHKFGKGMNENDSFFLNIPINSEILDSRYPVLLDSCETETGMASVLILPLRLHDKLQGLVVLGHTESGVYSGPDLYSLLGIGNLLAMELKSYLLNEKEDSIRYSVKKEEHRNLARELHDGVGQNLAYCKSVLETIIDGSEVPSESRDKLARANGLLVSTIKEIRSMATRLRLFDSSEYPEDVIRHYCTMIQEFHTVSVEFGTHNEKTCLMPPKFNENLLRIVQEGVSNATRHSGCTEIRISLEIDENDIRLQVTDDGNGLASQSEGMGMTGVRERAEILGAEILWKEKPGGGTILSLLCPTKSWRLDNDNTPD